MPIISLKITEQLHDRFEKVRNMSGFSSKSEALREAIVNFIDDHEKFESLEGYKIMTINMVYPSKPTIVNQLTDLYTRYKGIIKTITDWRIVEKKIELLLAVGEIRKIKDLYREIASIKEIICSINELIIE